jgi:hypothetical protein
MQNPNSVNKYYVDPVLASVTGHDLITDILIAYMQTQICTAWSVAHGNAFDSISLHTPGDSGDGHALFGSVGQRKGVPEPNVKNGKEVDVDKKPMKDPHHGLINVPPGRINTRPNAGRAYEEVAPFCVSASDLINPLPPSLFYGSGWFAYHPSTSAASSL